MKIVHPCVAIFFMNASYFPKLIRCGSEILTTFFEITTSDSKAMLEVQVVACIDNNPVTRLPHLSSP